MNELEQILAIRTIADSISANMEFDEGSAYLERLGITVHVSLGTTIVGDYRNALKAASDETLNKIAKQLELDLANITPTLPQNWLGVDGVKVFISHISKYKDIAQKLSESLAPYGLHCFVAHVDIEPTAEWLIEIQRALDTMDVFITVNTDGFDESFWCQQEVGYAFARKQKVLPIKFSQDPIGFLAKFQALDRGRKDAVTLASDIFDLLSKDDAIRDLLPRRQFSDDDDVIPF